MKKYEEIFKTLEKEILEGSYHTDDYLPSEPELSATFQVSRDTVRKALSLLEKEGYIRKEKGRGSRVINREQFNFPVSELTSYKEIVHLSGMSSVTNVISIDKVIINDKLESLTGFPKNHVVWRVQRQRVVDGIASVLDVDYLDKALVPEMTRDIAADSIYNYLENELHLDIAFAQKEITIENITEADKILLDLGSDKHVVSIKSKVYLQDGKQFQFTESRHKLEKFRFVDFARRKHQKT